MDKYNKYNDSVEMFAHIEKNERPDGPVSQILTKPTNNRRKQDDIFKIKNADVAIRPIISDEIESEIILDVLDVSKNETLIPVKRKGRGKDLKKRVYKPRSEKQLQALKNARERKLAKNKKTNDTLDRPVVEVVKVAKVVEPVIQPVKVAKPVIQPVKILEPTKTIEKPQLNDFDTFCDYMDRYNLKRKPNIKIVDTQPHPNKIVHHNLLPRPPLVNNIRQINNDIRTVNRHVQSTNYAINMLTSRNLNWKKFKDPFNY